MLVEKGKEMLSHTRQFDPELLQCGEEATLNDVFLYRYTESLKFTQNGESKTFVNGDVIENDKILLLSEYYWPRIIMVRDDKEIPLTGPVDHRR